MRTDRAGSQASRGTQGGKSYPRDNSQVMPVVIEIILPPELVNHWQSHTQGGQNWRTSLITSATFNGLPSPDCHSAHQPYFSVSVLLLMSRLSWDEVLMGKPYLVCLTSLVPWMDRLLFAQPNVSFSLWLISKWDTSVAHQMDKAQSH